MTEKDSLGHIIKYFYDENNGDLIAQIDVESGTGYFYDYSDWGTLEGVLPATGTAENYSKVTNAEKVVYTYDPDTHRLSKITTDTTEYTFSYDSFGNSNGVIAGNNTLATYEYYPSNGKLKKISYGNGFSEEYLYDSLEMLAEIWYTYDDGTEILAYSYTYNSDGTLDVFTNHLDETSIKYTYDVHGRFISSSEIDSSSAGYTNNFLIDSYDPDGRVANTTNTINYFTSLGSSLLNIFGKYNYNNNGTLKDERVICSTDSYAITDYYYDCFNRVTKFDRRTDGFRYTFNYTYYLNNDNKTNGLVSEVTSTINGTSTAYNYTYNSRGYIATVENNGVETVYFYDDLGQLTQEYNDTTVRYYTYDNAGNIVSIKSEPVSSGGGMIIRALLPLPTLITERTLGYSDSQWGDLLTSYNGTAITYDEIGNPLSYYNGIAYTFTWTGRQLTGAVKGSKTMSFTYDDNGIRTSKTVNGVTHTYQLNGSQIVAEQWSNKLIVYLYDSMGMPIGMMYRTTSYDITDWDIFWFEKNLQGDIVAIYNETGTKVVSYNYTDAWGNHSVSYINGGASTGAQYNPFRYRGYYYDTDLGMYYLQSRYYDPNTCRFISPDTSAVLTATPMALTDKNLYAYCDNNPVMRVDEDGEFWHIVAGAVIGVVAQYIGDVFYNAVSGKEGIDVLVPSSSIVDYIAAGASGALAATGIGAIWSGVANAAIDGMAYLTNQLISGGEVSETTLVATVIFSFATAGPGINGNKMRNIYQHSKNVLETAVSPKKIAMYTAKIADINHTILKEIAIQINFNAFTGVVNGGIDRWKESTFAR